MMEVCGSVLTNSRYELFRLKCIYCTIESELKDWELFIVHVKTAHYCEEEDTKISETKQESQEMFVAVDASDPAIAYGPDELFEVIEDNNAEEKWVLADANDFQYVEEATAWSDPNADYQPYGSQETTPKETMKMEESSQNHIPLSNDQDDGECSDFYVSEDDVAPPKKRPVGRPPRRTRPGQVFKFKVSFIRSNPRVLHLIHAYKEHPCLWNPSHENYQDEEAHNMAYEAIMERMDRRANVLFTVEELKKTIEQLHIQYTLALETKQKGKLVGLAERYFAKCEYLSVAPSITPKENEEEDDDLIVIKLNFKEENLVTTSFIETYANYPGLYNPDLAEFTSVEARANAYRRLAKEFQPVVKANETDVYIAVNKLRRWLYDAMRRLRSKELIQKCCQQEVQYLRMCSFLPAKGSESSVLYCDYCEKRFHGDYNLRVHIFKAHQVGDLPYLCSLCPRRFDRQVDMDRHKLRTHFERKLRCQYCNKSFAVDNDLKVHVLIHTGERPHVCDICGKTFRLKLLLDHHVNGVHLNIRPYSCDLCSKTFRKKFELANHIKGHLNIRDKKCEYCEATFYDHSSLSRHRRSHKMGMS
ncbi:uncharacterized protein [Drosophila takahashii]|uniref:uncharacterized protein n=1 Tax=Drosophila takahashii TaxID=29030 RepID=UPI003898E58E